MKSNDCFRAH